jgi:hypothetical protein
VLVELVDDFKPTGDMGKDVVTFLARHGCPKTAEHCRRVAAERAL